MTRIFKYALPLRDEVVLDLPAGAEILSIEEQSGWIVVYALIDDERTDPEPHRFRIVGTGHPCPDLRGQRANFLGTVKLAGGSLMFHVFHNPSKPWPSASET